MGRPPARSHPGPNPLGRPFAAECPYGNRPSSVESYCVNWYPPAKGRVPIHAGTNDVGGTQTVVDRSGVHPAVLLGGRAGGIPGSEGIVAAPNFAPTEQKSP